MSTDKTSLTKSVYRKIRYTLFQRNLSGITSSMRKLPDFMVIGGKRCGTTTLFEFLKQHPNISNSPFDHIGFFDDNYRLGIDYYKSFFPIKNKKNNSMLDYDVTTSYLTSPYVPERIYKHIPNIKLIVLLRNPTARAWSEYNSILATNNNQQTFETYIDEELNELENYDFEEKVRKNDYNLKNPNLNYIKKGLYVYYIKKWLALFPKKNILIFSTEEFGQNENLVFEKIFKFLELPHHKINNFTRMSKSNYKNKINPETKKKLDNFFYSKNQELFKLLNHNFSWS